MSTKTNNDVSSMNIHQKLLKIADMAGVLQRNKTGYNYNYTTEDEIQAKITAGMQKYKVMLYPSIEQGSLQVQPYHYEKVKKEKVKNEQGKDVLKDTIIPVNEVIVKAEVIYTWVNVDNPEEKIENRWAYIGQMEDASQAFGAGATYGNRYYLLKALQLATVDDDPDEYRSKQKKAENYENELAEKEMKEALKAQVKNVTNLGNELIKLGFEKVKMMEIVANLNNGNGNPNSITSIDIANAIIEEFIKIKETLKGENK